MAKLSEEQLKKLARIALIAELEDNFEALEVLNSLIYEPGYPAPAATDGTYITISDDFFNYTPEEMYFIINHEFLHIYFKHVERFLYKGLDRYITNIATDLIINEMLVNEGQKMVEGGVTRFKIEKEINKKILGRTSKEVYNEIKDYLLKKMEKNRLQQEQAKNQPPEMIDPPREPVSSNQKSESSPNSKYKYAPGDYVRDKKTGKVSRVITAGIPDSKTGVQKITLQEVDENEINNLNFNQSEKLNVATVIQATNDDVTPYYAPDQKDSQNQDSQANKGDQQDQKDQTNQEESKESGNSNNLPDEQITKALEELLGKDKGEEYKDKIDKEAESVKKMDAKDGLTDEEKQEIEKAKERLKEKVASKKIQANQKETKEIERNYTPPVVDWKKILQKFLGRYLIRKEARNWRRPTNRYDEIFGAGNVVLPSSRGYKTTPFINVYLDVSGSMSGIIGLVREELFKAKRFFKQYKAKYHEFDTEIMEIDKKSFFQRSGAEGGGTDIRRVIAHYMQDKRADLCVLVTDAEDEFQTELDIINKPLLLITNNRRISTNNRKITLVITDFQ